MGGARHRSEAPGRHARTRLPQPYHARVPLIDSHCHLNADRFEGDADLVIGGARLAGVERILVPGLERRPRPSGHWRWSTAIRGSTPRSASTRTTRPRSTTTAWGAIAARALDERVVAIGETGLDYDRVFSPIPDQLRNLRRNLALALETGKPAILHCRSSEGRRDAQDALLAELRAAGVGDGRWDAAFGDRPPAIIHSYSGPVDYGRAVIDLGLAISFSGLVFRRGEEASGDVAALVPDDRRPRGDRLAVPVTARCTALAQRTGVGPRHSGMGRGTSLRLARGVRAHPRRRLRSNAPDPSEDRMTPASRRIDHRRGARRRPAPSVGVRAGNRVAQPERGRQRIAVHRAVHIAERDRERDDRAGRLAERRRGLRRRAARRARSSSDRMTDVRISSTDDADIITFVFANPSAPSPAGPPRGDLTVAEPPYSEAASGQLIDMQGDRVLQVRFLQMFLYADERRRDLRRARGSSGRICPSCATPSSTTRPRARSAGTSATTVPAAPRSVATATT